MRTRLFIVVVFILMATIISGCTVTPADIERFGNTGSFIPKQQDNRPLQVGDVIEWGDHTTTVAEIWPACNLCRLADGSNIGIDDAMRLRKY